MLTLFFLILISSYTLYPLWTLPPLSWLLFSFLSHGSISPTLFSYFAGNNTMDSSKNWRRWKSTASGSCRRCPLPLSLIPIQISQSLAPIWRSGQRRLGLHDLPLFCHSLSSSSLRSKRHWQLPPLLSLLFFLLSPSQSLLIPLIPTSQTLSLSSI